MPGSWLVAVSLCAAPVTPPAPRIDDVHDFDAHDDDAAQVEGPSRPPEPDDGEDEDDSAPGIEFARPPDADDSDNADADAEERENADALATPEAYWPDPGNAPADGSGFFVGGGVLVPTAAIITWGLLLDPTLSSVDRSGILVAGGGMELLGLIALGMGGIRRAKLVRWAGAYRVIPTPQGGGLLALGGLGVTSGLTLLPLGILILARGGSSGTALTMISIGALAGAVIAPLSLSFGNRRRHHYAATGGWKRRPIPELLPTVSITRDHFGIGAHGRF